MLLSMLEGCRTSDVPLDAEKFIPPGLRPPKPRQPASKSAIAAFRGALSAGEAVREAVRKR